MTPKKVLIVDDEPHIARSMMRILRGHDVVIVNSGNAALTALAEASFDLIFCDLMMPGMTGMDLYRALAEQRPGCQEKMVFMSGGAFTERGQNFLSQVPNVCLHKPFDIGRVRDLVTGWSQPAISAVV